MYIGGKSTVIISGKSNLPIQGYTPKRLQHSYTTVVDLKHKVELKKAHIGLQFCIEL